MSKVIVSIALAVALFTGFYLGRYQVATVQAQQQVQVPKAWGSLKGTAERDLIFEDSAGTLRFVRPQTGTVDIPVTLN